MKKKKIAIVVKECTKKIKQLKNETLLMTDSLPTSFHIPPNVAEKDWHLYEPRLHVLDEVVQGHRDITVKEAVVAIMDKLDMTFDDIPKNYTPHPTHRPNPFKEQFAKLYLKECD